MKIFQTLQELAACIGQTVAVSPWTEITQEQVNMFAEATGDHQWIHIDVEKAKAGPFGAPIAHGFFDLVAHSEVVAKRHQNRKCAHGRELWLEQSPLHIAGAGG